MVLIINKYFGNISRISKNAVAKNKWQLLKLQNKVQMESYCSKLNLSCSFSIDQMVSHFQIVLPSWQPQEPGAGTRERREPIKIWLDPSSGCWAGIGWGALHSAASLPQLSQLTGQQQSFFCGRRMEKDENRSHVYKQQMSNNCRLHSDIITKLLVACR